MVGVSDGTQVTGLLGNDQDRANGGSATIGFQNLTGTEGISHSFQTVVTGGLSNRTLRYSPTLAADGSATVSPARTTTYEICVQSADHTACEEVTIVAIGQGDVMVSEIMAAPAAPVLDPAGEWFELRNTTRYPIDLNGWE